MVWRLHWLCSGHFIILHWSSSGHSYVEPLIIGWSGSIEPILAYMPVFFSPLLPVVPFYWPSLPVRVLRVSHLILYSMNLCLTLWWSCGWIFTLSCLMMHQHCVFVYVVLLVLCSLPCLVPAIKQAMLVCCDDKWRHDNRRMWESLHPCRTT